MKATIRRGVTLVEIAIAFLILSIAVVPLIGLYTGGREQASMSEHQIYAELASVRCIEDYATRHYGFLYKDQKQNHNFFAELEGIDDRDGHRNGWWDRLTEFQQNAWKAVEKPTCKMTVEGAGPENGLGIMVIKVSAFWGDLSAITKVKENQYHLLRLRAKRDLSFRTPPNDEDPEL